MGICLSLALAVWAVFGQTLHHDFVYDDIVSVYENPFVIQGLTFAGIGQLFAHIDLTTHDWWPLTEISHMLDWQFYGPDAGGHHLTNVLLHAATAILLFLVLRKMTGALWRSAFVAAVFAIHPLRVESVAWVTERKDVLSGLFFMLTLWAYTCHARRSAASDNNASPPKFTFYLLALIFFALGLMSKSMLVTLPFILILLDYWPLKRFAIHDSRSATARLAWEKLPFLLMAAAAGLVTLVAQRDTTVQTAHSIGLPWRLGNALVSYAVYVFQMVCPMGLAVHYPHLETRLSLWMSGGAALVLLVISIGVAMGRQKRPYLLVGWLWYLVMLLPVIGLVPVGAAQAAHADRYTYLPQIGLYILVAWGAVELSGFWKYHRLVLGAGSAVILAGLLADAHVQTGYWKSEISLWTRALACTSGNSVAHNNLGIALANQGKLGEAIQQYEKALQIKPGYAEAHYNLGDALAARGELDEAVRHYERALQFRPAYVKAYNNLGKALLQKGRVAEAIANFQRAMEIAPEYSPPYNNLAWILATHPLKSVRNGVRAVELAQLADRFSGGKDPGVLDTLAAAYAENARFAEAVETASRGIELANAQRNFALVTALESHIKLYKANQPLRED